MPTSENVHIQRFRSKAKSLHKSVRAASPEGLARIAPYFSDPGSFKLTQAQLVIAREANLNSWREVIGKDDWISCSFCKKWQYDLKQLIAGPDDVFVCDGCVELCNEIIRDHNETS